jgi:hypothetical protein
VIECNWGRNYRIEHMNKARLERLGLLVQSILAWDGANGSDDDNLDIDSGDDETVVER